MAALWRDRDPARSWKAAGMVEARVVSLHRYPVKSLLGEDLDAVELDERGVVGDRMWSVRTPDGKIGSGKTTRRFQAVPGLLQLRASSDGGRGRVGLPGGGCASSCRTGSRCRSASSKPLRGSRRTCPSP